jgi:hypothetical protein
MFPQMSLKNLDHFSISSIRLHTESSKATSIFNLCRNEHKELYIFFTAFLYLFDHGFSGMLLLLGGDARILGSCKHRMLQVPLIRAMMSVEQLRESNVRVQCTGGRLHRTRLLRLEERRCEAA